MQIFSKIYPAIFLISILLILIETISYSGFFLRNFHLDLKILILFVSFLSLIFPILKIKLNPIFIKFNNLFFIFSIISAFVFTLIEKLNYPNFVFSTFHLNYETLTYLVIMSGILFISSYGIEIYKKNKKSSLFLLGLFLLNLGFLVRNWPDGTFFQLIREDQIFEQLQFVFYITSGVISGILMLKSFLFRKHFLVTIFYLLFFVFLIFVSGEEISWGQRLLNISTPENLAQINTQEETTLHNINVLNPLQYLMYMTLSIVLSLSWIFKNYFPKSISEIFPDKSLIPYFLPIFIFYLHINFLNGKYWEWQEFTELLLSIGLFIFFYLNYKLIKK